MSYGPFFLPWTLGALFNWPIGLAAGAGPRAIVDGVATFPPGPGVI